MPESGAQPVPNQDFMDAGDGIRATLYTDGSVVFWREDTREQVGYLPPGAENPQDLGGGRAAILRPDKSLLVFDIHNPPPEVAGMIPTGSDPGSVPAAPAPPVVNPRAPTGPVGTGRPGEDFNYGPDLGLGKYADAYAGQTVPGRKTDVPFGSTVAPSTWNAASPGRSEGWGSIGAGTEGQPYGWGVPGFGQAPIQINQRDLPHLSNAAVAPGYIPGSGTYNQYRLDSPTNQFGAQYGGLFSEMPLNAGGTQLVNNRFGLGGTGDPTTGGEVQTPERWVTGVPTASTQPMQGDPKWRATGGTYKGGGGFDPALAAAVPAYSYSSPSKGEGGGGAGGGSYNNGSPQHFFGTTVSSNWGQTPDTAGMDYIGTLFMRPDTPTGVGTPTWSAPQAMWDGLIREIRSGRITVDSPEAWAMLRQRNPAYTPQSIGGAALTGRSGESARAAGVAGGTTSGGTTEDAVANANAAAAADKAAYWAYQQSLLRQGDQRIAMEAARDAWTKSYQEAGLTGQYNGQDTSDWQATQAGLTGFFQGNPTMAREQFVFQQEMQKVANDLAAAGLLGTYQGQQTLQAKAQEFSQRLQQQQFGLSEAGVTGTYNGAPTMEAINQQNQTALGLMGLQAQLQGPRNWDRYQSTFNATPNGLQDVMAAFQGRYTLPGAAGAQGTAQGGRQSTAGLAGDILSGTYGADGTQQPQSVGNPYQADVRNWSRMQPSQREMVIGKAENQGWYGSDFENLLRQAAPKYAGATGGSYSLFK